MTTTNAQTADGDPIGIPSSLDVEDVLSQNRTPASPFIVRKCESNAAANWDRFYKRHEDRFFHNRNWTDREFQALKDVSTASSEDLDSDETQALVSDTLLAVKQPLERHTSTAPISSSASTSASPSPSTSRSSPVLLEVGCGVGNMLYPLLEKIPDLTVHCCDFSPRAVEIVKRHPAYDAGRVNAFVFDLTQIRSVGSEEQDASRSTVSLSCLLPTHPFGPPSLISVIFVLSAIPPFHHKQVLHSLFTLLRPGGTLLFRDYARGDLAQVRFHSKEKWAEPCLLSGEYDYYRRGDGTMSFFFEEEYVRSLAKALGEGTDGEGGVQSEEVKVVERMGVNRKRGIQLKRRFIQGVWRKKG